MGRGQRRSRRRRKKRQTSRLHQKILRPTTTLTLMTLIPIKEIFYKQILNFFPFFFYFSRIFLKIYKKVKAVKFCEFFYYANKPNNGVTHIWWLTIWLVDFCPALIGQFRTKSNFPVNMQLKFAVHYYFLLWLITYDVETYDVIGHDS